MLTAPDPGSGRELVGACCRHCGSADTWLEVRLEPKPVGTWSLAGQQTKVAAAVWPYLVCDGCGHVSRGQVTADTN